MKKMLRFLMISVFAFLMFFPGIAPAGVVDFSIKGNYVDSPAWFATGEFTIQGKYDTEWKPVYHTKNNQIVDIPDMGVMDYSTAIVRDYVFTNMPFFDLVTSHPSDPARFSDDSVWRRSSAVRIVNSHWNDFGLKLVWDYTELYISSNPNLGNNSIVYGHSPSNFNGSRINLNVTEVIVGGEYLLGAPPAPVPVPSAVLLLGTGLLGLAGFCRPKPA